MDNLTAGSYRVSEPSLGKQTQAATIDNTQEIPIFEGNTNDCGPMLAYLFGLSSKNSLDDIRTLDEVSSNSLGQRIRLDDMNVTSTISTTRNEHSDSKQDLGLKPQSYAAALRIRSSFESHPTGKSENLLHGSLSITQNSTLSRSK